MWEELDKLHKTLSEIEKAFYLVAAHDSELQAFGLRRISKWFDLGELLPLFDAFPIELASCKRIIEIVDHQKYVQLTGLLHETKLEELITRFTVKLKIAERERPIVSPIALLLSSFRVIFRRRFTSDLFSNDGISMEGVLSAITRIKSLLTLISQDIKERRQSDNEIFKPSNINITQVTIEIDSAMTNINEAIGFSNEERAKLIDYLEEAKAELARKDPAWRKVIGALVICATLLGGAAVAPQAAENVNKAITYILGTSIPHTQKGKLTLPRKQDTEPEVREPTTRAI
ncbi:MAG: hypothetical protein ABW077_08345 [Candidatus Thiodiazotropha endolucinida]